MGVPPRILDEPPSFRLGGTMAHIEQAIHCHPAHAFVNCRNEELHNRGLISGLALPTLTVSWLLFISC